MAWWPPGTMLRAGTGSHKLTFDAVNAWGKLTGPGVEESVY